MEKFTVLAFLACAVIFIKFLKLQSWITANWDIPQKNGFYYHNLEFMMNLIPKITHASPLGVKLYYFFSNVLNALLGVLTVAGIKVNFRGFRKKFE